MSSIEFENQNDIVKEKLFSNDKDTFDTFKDLYFLTHNLCIYSHFLYKHMTYKDEINTYSQFFIYESCMRHLTIGLGMLFTKKDRSEKATGCAFLSRIFDVVENIDNTGCQIFSEPLRCFISYKKSFDDQKRLVQTIYDGKIKIYRDKRYAHLDSDFHSQITEINQVYVNDIKSITDFCSLVKVMCIYIFRNKIEGKQKNQIYDGSVFENQQLLELYRIAGGKYYE
ncbi:predicted protein [Francisella tularensis subsp. novicida GA99-3548]|uniref:hypothetical protein n=1 Tax=Francisella tularensis TaxID=263 RepID=UPI000158B155|nr:hypothetical protein [Francisella tularensis]AJI73594.1 hypothetical protein AQ14_1502 [Francisella tularensis subsp. novicida D9876]EDN37950.1 predicted protein [Francisella tularensis subsp. novicida GA99-3548]MBK2111561.1 hypothetical protein [Francisella tularensis subsp. novicida FSC159]